MNQHLVSQVLLRRFLNHKGGRLQILDLDTRVEREDKVERVGSLQNLVAVGADETEQKWQTVERRMPYAFDLLDKREILNNAPALETIRDCIALHYGRGFALAEMFAHMQPHYADQVADGVLDEVAAPDVIKALTGLEVPPGVNAHAVARQRIQSAFRDDVERKGLVAQLLLRHFDMARERVASKGLEFNYATDGEFLIGDLPVATVQRESTAVGPLNGVTWDAADTIFMPLGPKWIVALAKENSYRDADARTVEAANARQTQGALREVYSRSGSGLGAILADALDKNP